MVCVSKADNAGTRGFLKKMVRSKCSSGILKAALGKEDDATIQEKEPTPEIM